MKNHRFFIYSLDMCRSEIYTYHVFLSKIKNLSHDKMKNHRFFILSFPYIRMQLNKTAVGISAVIILIVVSFVLYKRSKNENMAVCYNCQ
jgi:hypothetical protein